VRRIRDGEPGAVAPGCAVVDLISRLSLITTIFSCF
jgi:hypothetical protein